MKVTDFLRPELVIPQLGATTKADALTEISTFVSSRVDQVAGDKLESVLLDRERLASTAIGDGIAIPHGKLESVDKLVGRLWAFVRWDCF